MSDPARLFSPSSQLSSLTSTSSAEPRPRPPLTMPPTRRTIRCYVAPPTLPPSVKELYQQTPAYLGGDPEFTRDDLNKVVGEYPLDGQGKPSHYFVRFADGLAYRVSHALLGLSKSNFLQISSHTLLAKCGDLVNEYRAFHKFSSVLSPQGFSERRKAQGLLDHFDPASDDVHKYSRMNPRITVDAASIAAPPTSSESDISGSPLTSDSPLTEEDDGSGSDDYGLASTRKSARLAAGNTKFIQSKLPFSPKKLRNNRARQQRLGSGSEDDLGGYGQVDSDVEMFAPRRSTRSRRSARSNLADDLVDEGESDGDSYHGSPAPKSKEKARKRLKKKRSVAARPAYGHFRNIDDLDFDPYDDEATSSLRAHREICEKCHKRPAHEELSKVRKGRRKTKVDEDESDDDDDEHIRGLGGWVRWFGCPVVYFFNLLI